jgi:hypothetical protein
MWPSAAVSSLTELPLDHNIPVPFLQSTNQAQSDRSYICKEILLFPFTVKHYLIGPAKCSLPTSLVSSCGLNYYETSFIGFAKICRLFLYIPLTVKCWSNSRRAKFETDDRKHGGYSHGNNLQHEGQEEGKVVLVLNEFITGVEAYGGSGGITPLFLTSALDGELSRSRLRPIYPRYTFYKRLAGILSRFGHLREQKILPCRDSNAGHPCTIWATSWETKSYRVLFIYIYIWRIVCCDSAYSMVLILSTDVNLFVGEPRRIADIVTCIVSYG